MQQLIPHDPAADPTGEAIIDVARLIGSESRAHPDRRPWLFTNMVATIDGAATVDGRSGGLGGPGDREVFSALRAEADVIVVGAQTVRDEQYRLARAPGDVGRELRRERAQAERPRLCIVTRSADLGESLPLLGELPSAGADAAPWQRPLIATTARRARRGLDQRFDVLETGADSVDLADLIDQLGGLGLRRILCEGGPSLLAQLGAAGLVDEWNFTVAPIVAAGPSVRPLHSERPLGQRLRLERLYAHGDGTLFTRYLTDHNTTAID